MQPVNGNEIHDVVVGGSGGRTGEKWNFAPLRSLITFFFFFHSFLFSFFSFAAFIFRFSIERLEKLSNERATDAWNYR